MGPLCPTLLRYHRNQYLLTTSQLPLGRAQTLARIESVTIDVVLQHYGPLSGLNLLRSVASRGRRGERSVRNIELRPTKSIPNLSPNMRSKIISERHFETPRMRRNGSM